MASLVAKDVHGHRYWQLVTSRRVDGKPRQVVLAHLGTADTLLARLSEAPGKPLRARVTEYGLLTAIYKLALELDLVAIIDKHVPKRHQGASIGQYMLLAALNRLSAPTSKSKMLSWYQRSVLPRLIPLPATHLRSQRFWDAMDALDEEAIERIEAAVSYRLVELFHVDLRCLCFDCTNFDTFIDTETYSELARRGHAKSKRTDLRLVGLALLVSTDFGIPLFTKVYPGNQPDAVTFASVTERLVDRYRLLAKNLEHVTLVFDKGNNSEDNMEEIAASPYHVVGSLVPSQHGDLLDIPIRRFKALDHPRLDGVRAYRTSKEVFGREWTIVITRSYELALGQLRGIAQHLRKRMQLLAEIDHKLRRSQLSGRGTYTREQLQAKLEKLTSGQYIRDILKAEVVEQQGSLSLSYGTDREALRLLIKRVLGKRILFTDNHDWTTEEIVLAYRSQSHVEAAFRRMKDPHFVSWEPMYHWTDQKIRVHAFYCVLALMLAGLMQRKAHLAGLALSFDQLADELGSIREVINIHSSGPKGGRPHALTTYTEVGPTAARLAEIFDLAPTNPG